MDIGKAFSFVFDDEQWISSILVGALLTFALFIPLVNFVAIFALMGYMLETARNVAMGSPRPLPKWDNFGEKLSLGFNSFLINLVYALPLVLFVVIFACIAIAGGAASDSEAGAGIAVSLLFCLMPIFFIFALIIQPLILAATVRYLQTGSLGAAFKFGEIIAMVRADLGGWVVLWLLYLLCGLVASAGSIIFIGILFTYPYSQAVFGHLLGQKLRQIAQPAGYGAAYPAPPTGL